MAEAWVEESALLLTSLVTLDRIVTLSLFSHLYNGTVILSSNSMVRVR